MQQKKENKALTYVILYANFCVYSFTTVFSKLASTYPTLSLPFIAFYGASLLSLGIYAIIWQQVLKKIPLGTAYMNRSVLIVFGMLWGFFFFQETITWNMWVGGAIVLAGVLIVVKADE